MRLRCTPSRPTPLPCWILLALLLLVVDAARVTALSHDIGANASRSTADPLLWGSYRPNLYVGMRPRLPESLSFGLVWHGLLDYASYTRARHACEQDDGVVYKWTSHDGRTSGTQVIDDAANNLRLTASFVKASADAVGPCFRGAVAVAVDAARRCRVGAHRRELVPASARPTLASK